MCKPEKRHSVKSGAKVDRFDLDDVLRDEVGEFGRYQWVLIALIFLPVIFSGMTTGEYVFTTARIQTRCRIPECDSPDPYYTPNWLLTAINGTSLDSFDQCERFANLTTLSEPDIVDQCPAQLFDQSQTVACESYVYENTNTVVYDFNLACDDWRRSLIGSVRSVGSLIGLPIAGYISDRWGRRMALCITAFNTAWLGLIRSFVTSYEGFLVMELIEPIFGTGSGSSAFILLTEFVGAKYRVKTGVINSTIFALGHIKLGLVAWGAQSWRTLTRAVFVPQLITIGLFWILPESVRWLLNTGKYEEAEIVLKKVARMNRKEISEKSMEALRKTAEIERNLEKPKETWLPILVFRHKVILFRCFVVPMLWITMVLVYYGLSINAVNLSGNQYLNYIYVVAVEIPGFWTAIALLDRIGRKPVLIFFYFLCGICQFVFAFIPVGYNGVSMTVYLIGKFSIAVVATSIYIYTSELFPTKYRHSLFAFSSMIGRIGSIAAPMTPALAQEVWHALPSVLFGSLAFLSGCLLFTTPETLGTKLPDTMEEAEGIGKTKDQQYTTKL